MVHVPKLQHLEGKSTRVVPQFPELREHMEAAFDDAPEGAVQMISGKHTESNLRTTMTKIIDRAGLARWPKLFQNMRASRETELLDSGDYPAHVVAAWIGHGVKVQNKNYAQVTDDRFAKAALPVTTPATTGPDSDSHRQTVLLELLEKMQELGISVEDLRSS